MDVREALQTRRTIHQYRPDPIPQAVVAEILSESVWGPNHHTTEPWTFYAVTGTVKEQLAQLRGRLKAGKFDDPTALAAQRSVERAYREMATVPWVIVVTAPAAGKPFRVQEDDAATACATYGLTLAAWARGYGTFWSTGPLAAAPETYSLLEIPAGERIVGIVLLGVPDEAPPARRTPAAAKTHWLGV